MNREVNLTKRVQTPHGWRYCTVVLSANGRVKPDVVLVNGKQETHKEGAYYLEGQLHAIEEMTYENYLAQQLGEE